MSEPLQTPDVNSRAVAFAASGILGFLVIVLSALYLLFPNMIGRPLLPVAQFPAPSVTTDERTQRIELERMQLERLSGSHGAMPIAEAMAIIAGKGAAAYRPVEGGTR